MSVLEKLASALGRRDEAPNVALATALAASGDTAAIEELVEGLSARDKNIQSDCIKVLYEIGERKAGLIAPFKEIFAGLLGSKNNRLAWGAMTALDAIAGVDPQGIHPYLPAIVDAADTGSVITRDHAVGILIKLYAVDVYADDCFALLSEQLSKCPVNQLPMYAEMALPAIRPQHKAQFAATLQSRLSEIEKASKRTRVEKVIRKI
ncbi:MAG: hypothetical protein R2791_05680 [Saprospiraceae bacterium]|nr:hypothetical protein [Saprospiraceae bacterium]MCB9353565.1 hypothetical protein [Lewinellaceae bacterium]